MDDEQNSSSPNLGPNLDATHVDLGADLLEKTAMIPGLFPVSARGPSRANPADPAANLEGPGSVTDQLQSAKILMSEGLSEAAKKVLHQILIADSGNVSAKVFLKEIHELELRQIFGEEEIRRPYGRKGEQPELGVEVGVGIETDPQKVMQQLDSDLGLGIFSEVSSGDRSDLMDEFALELEKILIKGSAQDWIDMGVGFLEMELYPIAVRLFSGSVRRLDLEDPDSSVNALSATSLLALSLIFAGRPFEAIARIQPLLRNVEIKRENKIELFYLMGRAYESMEKFDFAFQFYRQVIEIDPRYRDIERRIRKPYD